ncbi:uncharacterized protein METZ01_LOCUS286851, partial [marine metagenome]
MKSEYEIIEYGSFARVYPNTHANRIFVFMGFQWDELDAREYYVYIIKH